MKFPESRYDSDGEAFALGEWIGSRIKWHAMQLVARCFAWLLNSRKGGEWEAYLGLTGVEPGHPAYRPAQARGRTLYETGEEAI